MRTMDFPLHLCVPPVNENSLIAPITLSLGSTDIWSCLEDGLRKIRVGPFTRYIPDLDCNTLHTRYPLPLAFRHLLKSDDQSAADDHPVAKDEEAVLQVVLSVLEVGREEFDFERPILSYGIDSLSATRLSSALQPFLPVSQVQLLAGLCLSELSANLKIRWQDSETQHHTAQEMLRNTIMKTAARNK